MGDAHVGLHARLMSQALRKLTGALAKSKCVAIFINQIREKVGVIYGNPEVTTGGRALKFYSSVRMEIRKADTIKDGNDVIGIKAKIKVTKNKTAPPFKTAEFDINYAEGISEESCIIEAGAALDIIDKSGAWFSYGDIRLGQGKERAKQTLKDNPEIKNEIKEKILDSTIRKGKKDESANSNDA